jgi:glucose-1-phosphate thymidylyltransferase
MLLISTPQDTPRYQQLLGDGRRWGINLSYAVQPEPRGIPQAFTIGAVFIGNGPCALILGDNIFYGHKLSDELKAATEKTRGATIFAYRVQDPERYGVIEFDEHHKVVSIEEKPKQPKTHFAQTGFAIYDNRVVDIARSLKPSARGELEITDLNLEYLHRGELEVVLLGRGVAWLDTGTHDAWLAASTFIETIEKRQGLKIACPEEIAYSMGYIKADDLERLAAVMGDNLYARYLRTVLKERE